MGKPEDWIFCVSLVMCTCNIWRNTLSSIFWSINVISSLLSIRLFAYIKNICVSDRTCSSCACTAFSIRRQARPYWRSSVPGWTTWRWHSHNTPGTLQYKLSKHLSGSCLIALALCFVQKSLFKNQQTTVSHVRMSDKVSVIKSEVRCTHFLCIRMANSYI